MLLFLINAITKPLFLDNEFLAEMGNVRDELVSRSNNHFRHLSLALRQAYGFYVMTDPQRLILMDGVKLDDVRRHYARTHTTSNLRFVIAGNLTSSRRRAIERALSTLELPEGQGRTALPLEKPRRLPKPLSVHNETVDNLYFYIDTFMRRRMTDREQDALGLINGMLTETFYSRILGAARERGLVYHISSGFGQTECSSNWWIGAQVLPKNAPVLFELVTNELRNIFAGKLDRGEIGGAKQYALGRYQRSGQTVGGTANGYAWRYFFDGQIDDYYEIPKRIKAVNKDDLIAIAESLFADKIWGFGTLGNSGEAFTRRLYRQLQPLWN